MKIMLITISGTVGWYSLSTSHDKSGGDVLLINVLTALMRSMSLALIPTSCAVA